MARDDSNNKKNGPLLQTIKYAPPPPELPVYGSVAEADASFVGRTNYTAALDEKHFIFGLKRTDRRRHVYVVGKSGVGKIGFLELLARQDVVQGYPVVVIDPYGTLVHNLLDFIPATRARDVVIIDPTDTVRPVQFNPFADVSPAFAYHAAQDCIDTLRVHCGDAWSARTEYLVRWSLLALFEQEHASIRALLRLLTDPAYRETIVAGLAPGATRDFWVGEYAAWSPERRDDAAVPVITKLSQFFADPLLAALLTDGPGTIHFDEALEQNRIILVTLAKGRIGEEHARFLGSLVLSMLKRAGMRRAGTPGGPQRRDVYCYLDELYALAGPLLEPFIADAYQYQFCLTLAHQYLAQLPNTMLTTLLGNVNTLAVFRVSGDDALRLRPEMAGVFDVRDMTNLGTRQFYIKMMIDDEVHDPFSADSLTVLPPGPSSAAEVLRAASREQYGQA